MITRHSGPDYEKALAEHKVALEVLKCEAWDEIQFYSVPGLDLRAVGYKDRLDMYEKITVYWRKKEADLWKAFLRKYPD